MSIQDFSGFTEEDKRRKAAESAALNQAYLAVPSIRGADKQTALDAALAELLAGRAGPVYNVLAYGATGDGTTDDTAAIQAAVTAAVAAGGGVVRLPTPSVSYRVTGTITIPASGKVIIEGHGQRLVKISTGTSATTAKTFVQGADDGNHAGGTAGYDGGGGWVRYRRLWLEGPNTGDPTLATGSIGIADWENGETILDDCFIQKYGTGYTGLGADIQQWNSTRFSFCGVGANLLSRCDQIDITGCYFTENATALQIESAYATRLFGGQFVGNTTADIILRQPATSSLPYTSGVTQTTTPDTRLDSGFRAYGTWFESLSVGAGTTRHVWIGKDGASGRVLRDVQFRGCQFVCANTTNVFEIDAAQDVKIADCDVKNGSVVSGAWIKINAVASVNQYVYDVDNHVPTSITRASGTLTFYQCEQRAVAGNVQNQIKANAPAITFATQANVGNRILSDGQALLKFQRNTGTEAVPTWVDGCRINYKGFEPARQTLVWGSAPAVQVNAGPYCVLDASSNIAATLAIPSGVPASGFTNRLTFRIRNTSGGAIATPIAFNTGAGGYKTNGAFVNPANGTFRLITFVYDDVLGYWIEESRSSADMS